VLHHVAAHPTVVDERIEAPLVVIGMFRAGTTFLSYLLDRDPANRALLKWESLDSVPPPTAAELREGPRVEASRAGNDMLEALNPAVRAIHHEEPDGPTECIAVLSQAFTSLSWEAIANVPSYGAWLLGADQTEAYRYHRRTLQVLQSGGARGRWTLKSPHHAIALDALVAAYPDARLVCLHRDPVVLSASVVSLIRTLSSTFTDADHGDYLARKWPALLEESIARVEAFRDARPDVVIHDVSYDDLVADPIRTVAGIYAAGGEELSGAARGAMTRYVDAHPRGELGAHRYDWADLRLDVEDLRSRFAGYVERHGITPGA